MKATLLLWAVLCSTVWSALPLAGSAQTTAAPKPGSAPQAPAGAGGDANALSDGFWTDWKRTRSSKEFTSLTAAVGSAAKVDAAATAAQQSNKQGIVDIAITRPDEAAKFLDAATAASNNAASKAAMATMINMRTSPEMRQAATPLLPPTAQKKLEGFRADLSTGIPGLPGIYLGDNAQGGRGAAPSGYAPVAGSSIGCPAR